jgi:hypothetical protein
MRPNIAGGRRLSVSRALGVSTDTTKHSLDQTLGGLSKHTIIDKYTKKFTADVSDIYSEIAEVTFTGGLRQKLTASGMNEKGVTWDQIS